MEIVDKSSLNADQLAQLKSHVYDVIGCCQDVELHEANQYPYRCAV